MSRFFCLKINTKECEESVDLWFKDYYGDSTDCQEGTEWDRTLSALMCGDNIEDPENGSDECRDEYRRYDKGKTHESANHCGQIHVPQSHDFFFVNPTTYYPDY